MRTAELHNRFRLEEIVPKSVFERFGSRSIKFFDPVTIRILNILPKRYSGKIYLNTWLWGGDRDEAGYRLPDTPTGSFFSQHKFGRAIDPKFENYTPEEIDSDIKNNEELFLEIGLTTVESVELTPTWNHLDCRITGLKKLLIVEP